MNVAALFVLVLHGPPGVKAPATAQCLRVQAVFARAAFSLPLILGWIAAQGPLWDGLRMARPGHHLLRGTLGTVALSLELFLALHIAHFARSHPPNRIEPAHYGHTGIFADGQS